MTGAAHGEGVAGLRVCRASRRSKLAAVKMPGPTAGVRGKGASGARTNGALGLATT